MSFFETPTTKQGQHVIAVDDNAFSLLPGLFDGFEENLDHNWCLREIKTDEQTEVDLFLEYKNQTGLTLYWHKTGEKKPLIYHLDFSKSLKNLTSFPAPKQGAFNQALGNKSKNILDATGGWGSDALLMATQGYRVTILERNFIMALLLQEAFSRLALFAAELDLLFVIPRVHHCDSVRSLDQYSQGMDCVYLDPMFPPKRKKKAAVNKKMQLLQWLIGEDADADTLVQHAINCGVKRVTVKRPDYAEPLFKKPSQQFSSKLIHYDVYLQD